MERYQHSPKRNDIRFGFGELKLPPKRYQNLDPEKAKAYALELGWSNGCPVARELTDPTNEEYGPHKMIERYAQTNWWFDWITRWESRRTNRRLYDQLTTVTERSSDEPVGKHEAISVPGLHLTHMFPMSHPVGYALPRVVIEETGRGSMETRANKQEMIDKLEAFIMISHSPSELLARVSGSVAAPYVTDNPVAVLSHALSSGVMEEENCPSQFAQIMTQMETHSPDLLRVYIGLSDQEKIAAGIAIIR